MGELLRETPRSPGKRTDLVARGNEVKGHPTYEDLGIERTMAHRCQAIAEVPASELEEIISDALEEDRELTSKEVRKRCPAIAALPEEDFEGTIAGAIGASVGGRGSERPGEGARPARGRTGHRSSRRHRSRRSVTSRTADRRPSRRRRGAQGRRPPPGAPRVDDERPVLPPGDEAEMLRPVAAREDFIAAGAAGIGQDQGLFEVPGGAEPPLG
jgi:hypothetical protein